MIGVEFVKDRATREPDGALPDRLIARCADAGLLLLTCGTAAQGRALDPAARRHGGRDHRGGRDLRRGARSRLRRPRPAGQPPATMSVAWMIGPIWQIDIMSASLPCTVTMSPAFATTWPSGETTAAGAF